MSESASSQLLFGSVSPCHRAPSVIVRSRTGGFLTQDCERCGKPRALRRDELPDLMCPRCSVALREGVNTNGNYAYSCATCGYALELAQIVREWSDLFGYHGFGLEGD